MEFSRPEYWSGWLFPSPGDLPNPGIEPRSPALQANFLPAESPWKYQTVSQIATPPHILTNNVYGFQVLYMLAYGYCLGLALPFL